MEHKLSNARLIGTVNNENMEIVHGKHVKLICSLHIGMKVKIDGWGYKFDGKQFIIQDIKRETNCLSGFMVKIEGYEYYIDSDWITIL